MKDRHNKSPESTDYMTWFAQAFEALGVNGSEVAKKIGSESMKIYNILNGKFKPGYETIQQILTAYPRLNANWLFKGEKPILHTSSAEIIGSAAFNPITLPLLSTGIYNESTTENFTMIASDRNLDDCLVIRLTDDSLVPRYTKGTQFLARPVKQPDWEYVNSKLCAVLYRNTFVIRQIRENDLIKHKYLTLYAFSEESGYVVVRAEDLRGVYEILEIVGGGVV